MGTTFLMTANLSVQGQIGSVTIIQLTTNGATNSFVNPEQTVTLAGTNTTTNGPYQIYYENTLVASGNAVNNNVVTNFTVPDMPAGAYGITLVDRTTGENATQPEPLYVT